MACNARKSLNKLKTKKQKQKTKENEKNHIDLEASALFCEIRDK